MNAPTLKSNGLLAREKGQSLANDALDAFSNDNCPEVRRAWFEESMFDLLELPRLDAAIPGFVEEMAPVLAVAADVEAKVLEAESKKLLPLYEHPEGGIVAFDKETGRLLTWVSDERPSYCEMPIGPLGLRELAAALLDVADEMEGGK
jgi:hypothetical protein